MRPWLSTDVPVGRVALVALALLGAACGGTNDEPPEGGAELTIGALDQDPSTPGVTVDGALVWLQRVSLKPCAPDAAALSTDALPVDLFRFPSAHLSFESSVTEYCGVTLDLTPANTAKPAELSGRSLHLTGARADDAPLVLDAALPMTLDLVADGAQGLDAMKLYLGVDLGAWLADVDPAGASVDASGTAVIDADSDPDAIAAIDADTPAAFALYVDSDGDESLSGDERTPVATATRR